jgi:hypothetical protein
VRPKRCSVCEEPVEELARAERRLELGGAVEEGGCGPTPTGSVSRSVGDRDDLDPVLRSERVERGVDRRLAVAEIRAKPTCASVTALSQLRRQVPGYRSDGLVTVTPTVPSRLAGRIPGFRYAHEMRSGAKAVFQLSATAVRAPRAA